MIINIIDLLGYKKQIFKSFLNQKPLIFSFFLEIDETLSSDDIFHLDEKLDFTKPLNQMIGQFFLAVFNNRIYFSQTENCFFLITNKPGLMGGYKCENLPENLIRSQLFKILENTSDSLIASLLISEILNYIKKN